MKKHEGHYMKGIDLIAAVVLMIGGLCWGAIGLFGLNPVEALFGPMSPISRLIYVLFGMAALYEIIFYRMIQRRWECSPWLAKAERSPT